MENKFRKIVGKAYILAIVCALLLGVVMMSVPSIFMGKKTFTGVEICLTIILVFFSLCIIFGGVIQLIRDIKLKNSNILKKRFVIALIIFIVRLCIGDSVKNLFDVAIEVIDSVLMSFAFAYYYVTLKKEDNEICI